jgi:hypothetical protein
MARSYARIVTAIWRNAEFRKLRAGAQRVYLLLVTQPDITAAGTLPLTVRRWAEMAEGTTVQQVVECLDELATGRFIAMDKATEELLVRSFVRWDGGHTNSKRRPVIIDAAEGVSSAVLRRMLTAEFDRLGLPTGRLDVASDALSDSASGSTVAKNVDFDDELSLSQVDSLSDSTSDAVSPSERVVVTQVSTYQPTTHNPQTVPPSAADHVGAGVLVGEWIERCHKRPPKNVVGQMAKHIKSMLEEGISPEDIRAGIDNWMGRDVHPSTLPSFVDRAMNRSPVSSYQAPTDTNIANFLGVTHLRALPGGAS